MLFHLIKVSMHQVQQKEYSSKWILMELEQLVILCKYVWKPKSELQILDWV